VMPKKDLLLENQVITYNNTVAVYHWRHQQKVGVEIINEAYATLMRQMFFHYWDIAEDTSKD